MSKKHKMRLNLNLKPYVQEVSGVSRTDIIEILKVTSSNKLKKLLSSKSQAMRFILLGEAKQEYNKIVDQYDFNIKHEMNL